MARTARKPKNDDTGEVKVKDFAGAVRAYRHDIKPAISKVGEHNQEASTAYRHIKKNCHIQPSAAKQAFKLAECEDAKYEDYMRCLLGILTEMGKWPIPDDLVDIAQRPRPDLALVTLNPDHPDDDSDLADPSGEEPTAGTGAAAIAAMRAADAAEFDAVEETDLTH